VPGSPSKEGRERRSEEVFPEVLLCLFVFVDAPIIVTLES
jgi:hypothetical protein